MTEYNNSSNRGGGVLISVNFTLKSKVLMSVKCVEHVFMQFNLGFKIFILACVYTSPLSPLTLYEQFSSYLRNIFILISKPNLSY